MNGRRRRQWRLPVSASSRHATNQWLDEISAKRAGISPDEQQKRAAETIPLGRYGQPDEFGRAAAFLLSDAAAYITGASIQVDGGLIRGVF